MSPDESEIKPLGQYTIKSELTLFALFALPAFALDRLTKMWVLANLKLHAHSPFAPGIFDLCLTENRGAAFSLGNKSGIIVPIVASLTTATLLIWAVCRIVQDVKTGQRHFLERIGAGILIGASLGNLFDRFWQGYVTDFISLSFINFPVFNIADVLIDVGIALIMIAVLKPAVGKDAN